MALVEIKCIQDEQYAQTIVDIREQGFVESTERIDYLWNDQAIEDGENPLSFKSIKGFQAFITELNQLGEPVLGVFPEGTLSAEWRVSDNKHLLIEFLDDKKISFAMIGPDDDATDGKFRLNGRGRKKSVLETLNNNNVSQWPG